MKTKHRNETYKNATYKLNGYRGQDILISGMNKKQCRQLLQITADFINGKRQRSASSKAKQTLGEFKAYMYKMMSYAAKRLSIIAS